MADNSGTVTVDIELDIISSDSSYSDYVCDSKSKNLLANVYPEDQHLLYEMVEHLGEKSKELLCFRIFRKNNELSWVTAVCKKQSDREPFDINIAFRDISELCDEEEKNEKDFGTGLLNKKAITDYVIGRCKEKNASPFHLCILDIDNFKKVNDTMGHSYGDKILQEVGQIILETIGNSGKAGRIGGDEMMLAIDGTGDRNELRAFLKPIREKVERLHPDKDGYPLVTVSIGSGAFPTDVGDYERLFNLADRMLYIAKNRGKNRYVMYNPDVHGPIVDGEISEQKFELNDIKPSDKTKLVLDVLDGFFDDRTKPIGTVLMQMAATYGLDEVYIFYKDISKSFMGYKKLEDGKSYKIVESSADMLYVLEAGFENKFNSSGVFVIDTPQNQLKGTKAPAKYFTEHEIRHAFIYRMNHNGIEGYFAAYNTNEVSRKFSQSDVTDLTYLCKMIEITIKSR